MNNDVLPDAIDDDLSDIVVVRFFNDEELAESEEESGYDATSDVGDAEVLYAGRT